MPELESGAGESQPADDIRSALASAIATHETPVEAPAPKPAEKLDDGSADKATDGAEKTESQVEGHESEQTSERARGPDGKFVKKEDDEAEAAVADEKAEKKPETEKPVGIEPPVNWKAEDKETFKKLPGEAQKIVSEMVKRQDADYTRKTQAIAALRNEYEPVDKMFDPYREVMKQKGFTPRTLIEAWANVEKKLADNPLEVIAGLVNGYKVDRVKLATTLGIKAGTESAVEGAQVETLPPQFQSLQERQEALERQLAEDRRVRDAERRETAALQTRAAEMRVENEIEQFRSAKDEKGNLLRPHFEKDGEIEMQMTAIAQSLKLMGKPIPPIPELYETAVWANPSTREKLRTAETQQAEAKRKEEARAKAVAAKKAASSVTGAPSPGQTTSTMRQSDKSLREQLEEAAEESLSAA